MFVTKRLVAEEGFWLRHLRCVGQPTTTAARSVLPAAPSAEHRPSRGLRIPSPPATPPAGPRDRLAGQLQHAQGCAAARASRASPPSSDRVLSLVRAGAESRRRGLVPRQARSCERPTERCGRSVDRCRSSPGRHPGEHSADASNSRSCPPLRVDRCTIYARLNKDWCTTEAPPENDEALASPRGRGAMLGRPPLSPRFRTSPRLSPITHLVDRQQRSPVWQRVSLGSKSGSAQPRPRAWSKSPT
jgi:hypothetical protein